MARYQDIKLDKFRLPKKANIKFLFDDLAGSAAVLEPIVKAAAYKFNIGYERIENVFKLSGTFILQVESELRGSYEEWAWGIMLWDLTTGRIDQFVTVDHKGEENAFIIEGEV